MMRSRKTPLKILGKANDMIENYIYLVEKKNILKLCTNQITVDVIGCKALGLCQIPSIWTVPFFVISKELFAEYALNKDTSTIYNYIENIKSVIKLLDIKKHIILRSSAVNEGMKERGKFYSVESNLDNLATSLLELLENIKEVPNDGMPIVVQEFIPSIFTGHMSNERRFSQESRDWKIETYYENGKFEQDTIGIRTWRIKYDIDEIVRNPLLTDEKNVNTELQKVAYYWYTLSKDKKCRFHLEFVFDGKIIFIVQADRDYPRENSINPKTYNIKVNQLSSTWAPKILKQFNPNESSMFKKLQNVKSYNDLGFCTVPFYILDNKATLSDLRKGIVCEGLKEDLETLLKIQSVVIRMDINCDDILQKQMLPRSNEIQNYDHIISWIKEHVNIIPKEQELIFIFHNFVPAVSSAFAHAVPNGRLVKIQSLWGLPEGLYYNYHDTIIVDLGSKNIESITESDVKVTVKNRYKDLFIYPDINGNWTAREIKEPYDWRCSIESNSSIFEIAIKTQKLANKEQEEISVMWFVGIDDSFYGASNLPWFHEKVSFTSYTTDKYKRKYFKEEEIIINNSEELQELISSGDYKNKMCFRLKPNCEKDLRNKKLIENIGKIASENDIIILLDGTQLTHSYYQLKSTGAKVVCSDKDELMYSDTLEFNKLVRDKIPEKIISNGEHLRCSKVVRPLLDRLLLEKLLEEAYEVNDAITTEDIISELADLTEIINTILRINTETPISCIDVLNNTRQLYCFENNHLLSFKLPTISPIFEKMFKLKTLFGSISIQRKKTMYRVEFNLQNYPINPIKITKCENDTQIQRLKISIITAASLALNGKKAKNIINNINKINGFANDLCEIMGISSERVVHCRESKASKVGGFENGYVLNQTTLKDNVIDEIVEFDPSNCCEIFTLHRECNKYFELLQDCEKKRILLRFSVPIAVNEWEIFFSNSKIKQVLMETDILHFNIYKNNAGKLIMDINEPPMKVNEQLSLSDI